MVRAGRVPVRVVGGNPQPLLNVTRSWLPKVETGVGTLIELPGAPTGLAITSDSVAGSVRVLLLNWVVPAVSGHSAVGAYQVSIKSSNDNASQSWLFDTLDPFIQLFINTGFLIHEFRVRAMNDLGFGPWSETLEYTTPEVEDPDVCVPGPVRNLVVLPNDGSVSISWDQPAIDCTITHYEIERAEVLAASLDLQYLLTTNGLEIRARVPATGARRIADDISQNVMVSVRDIAYHPAHPLNNNQPILMLVGNRQQLLNGNFGNTVFIDLDGNYISDHDLYQSNHLNGCEFDAAGNIYVLRNPIANVYLVLRYIPNLSSSSSINVRVSSSLLPVDISIVNDVMFVCYARDSIDGPIVATFNLDGQYISNPTNDFGIVAPTQFDSYHSRIYVFDNILYLVNANGAVYQFYNYVNGLLNNALNTSIEIDSSGVTGVSAFGSSLGPWEHVANEVSRAHQDNNVANDTDYKYRIRTRGPAGDSPWTESSEVTPTASAGPVADLPGQVSGVASGNMVVGSRSVIRTTWPRVTSGGAVNDYNIQRRVVTSTLPTIEATEWQPRDDLGLRLFYDDDEDLTEGVLYQYRVQARGPSGEGDWSQPGNIVEFVPNSDTVLPGSPRNVSYQEGNEQLTVNWGIPIRGGTVDGYHVRHRSFDVNGNANQWLPVGAAGTDVGNVLTYPITNLVNGTDYNIQVRAYNTVGRGPWAPIEEQLIKVSPLSVPFPAPGVPRNFDETAGQNRVILDWDDPNFGGPFNDFALERRTENPGDPLGSWVDLPIGLINTHTDFDAVGGTTYRYRIRALGSGGQSGWVNSNLVIPTVPPPGVPFNVSADVVGTEIHFSWFAAIATGTVGASVSFDVQQRENIGDPWIVVSDNQIDTRYIIRHPVEHTRYELRVRATNASGMNSNYTIPEVVNYVIPVLAPGPTTNHRADPSSERVDLTWDNPDGPVTDIDIQRREGSPGNWGSVTSLMISGERTQYGDLTVDNGTTYQYRIKADNAVGPGPWSSWFPALGVTPGDDAPNRPTSVSGSSGDRQITWNWLSPSGGGSVDDYSMELRIDPENDGTFGPDISLNARPTGTRYISMSLTNGYGYQLRVRANGPGGMSAWSLWSSTAVPEAPTAIAPGTVGTIVLTPNNDASVVIRWTHPASGGRVTGYEIEVQAGVTLGTTWLPVTTVGVTEQYDTDPWPFVGLNHWFRIRALGPGGEGPWFVSVLPVTPRRSPGKPPKPMLTMNLSPAGGSFVALYSFVGQSPVDTGGATISSYAIEVQYRLASQPPNAPWTTEITIQQTSLTLSRTSAVNASSNWRARLLAFNVAGAGTWSDYSDPVLLNFPPN